MRGLALLGVAVVLGIILLNSTDNPRGATLASGRAARAVEGASTLPPVSSTLPARAPHDVRVLPANSTSVNGAGARVGNTLKAAGYDVLAATSVTSQSKATAILFQPGYDREAQAIATVLNVPAAAVQPLPSPPPFDTKGANVTVWIGPDLAGSTAPTTTQVTTGAPRTPSSTAATPATPRATTTTIRATTTTTVRATTTTRKP